MSGWEVLLARAQSEEEVFNMESLNDEAVVAPETTPPPELAPKGEKQLTDEDYDKLAKAKEAAAAAVEVNSAMARSQAPSKASFFYA